MDQGQISPTERVRIKSSPTSVGLDLSANHPKPNDVGAPEDSYLYLSATEEKLIANDNSNGSFLTHQHVKKKKLQKRPVQAVFLRNN